MAWHFWQDCPPLELERREIGNREADLSVKLVSYFSNNRIMTLMRRVAEKGTKSGDY